MPDYDGYVNIILYVLMIDIKNFNREDQDMGFMCYIGVHRWEGCKCTQCSKTRDEGHRWDDGSTGKHVCEVCGQGASEKQEIIDNINKSAG